MSMALFTMNSLISKIDCFYHHEFSIMNPKSDSVINLNKNLWNILRTNFSNKLTYLYVDQSAYIGLIFIQSVYLSLISKLEVQKCSTQCANPNPRVSDRLLILFYEFNQGSSMLNTTPWFETVLFCDQLPLLLSNLGNEMIYSMMNEVQVWCISAAVRRLLD